ncbi:lysosomal alpha-mannosidase-like [Convolutriloba macropyga]|uniref:lysosomal alpha-mannosidase-like n=1 Tax=Convolutriloba macropyga TaxID=536237 RepID=UPI003F51D1FA
MNCYRTNLIFLLCCALAISAKPLNSNSNEGGTSSSKCGYDSCPDLSDDLIHVHLVPHTHDDVGWLKNPEEYSYGQRDDIQRADVNVILNSVVDELLKDSSRRFIYVEMYFFSNWYKLQTAARKEQVKKLVNDGQLVFTNGGWCMNDEGAAHYNAIIDQMSLGLRYLNNTFGECGVPKVAWHIDPFGHSREQANLFAMMGFDSFFFGRLDYDDKNNRLNTKRMEEVWHAGNADLFFGALYNGYGPPGGFCFDAVDCSDEPIIDDPNLFTYNVNQRIDDFISAVRDQAQHYRTNHIIMTMGSDFQYMVASKWYTNLDLLIKYTNARQANGSNINVLYSTPMCYTNSLHKAGIDWTTKSDDFFPYASDPHSFWTGYFTSRPAQKGVIRKSNNLLQIARQLSVMSRWNETGSIEGLSGAMGVNQHHDAVTGTEKQAVERFYMEYMDRNIVNTRSTIKDMLGIDNLDFCPYRNISVCDTTENSENFHVVVYNPLARKVKYYVRVPVSKEEYYITDENSRVIVGDVMPVPNEESLNRLRKAMNSKANYELTFAVEVEGMSFATYTVQESKSLKVTSVSAKVPQKRCLSEAEPIVNEYFSARLKNKQIEVTFKNGKTETIELPSFGWYHASKGDQDEPASGAYCFRPQIQTPFVYDFDAAASELVQGKYVTEIRLSFPLPWLSGVARILADKPYIEFEWLVGPIPVEDGIAKEVVLLYNTSIVNNETFYTDSNGRQMLQRILNYRPTWNFQSSEPTSQNYYPVNSRIFINDGVTQATVLTDRSEGGTSMNSGQIEVMLHRRDLADDGFGVGEALNEPGQFGDGLIVRGTHKFIYSNIAEASKLHRLVAEETFMEPLVAFYPTSKSSDSQPKPTMTSANVTLPENIHLLTLMQLDEDPNVILLRLEHQFAEGEDADLSRSVTIDLVSAFSNLFTIKSARAMVLSSEKYAGDVSRLSWETVDGTSVDPNWDINYGLTVTLAPMEIKTIELEIE